MYNINKVQEAVWWEVLVFQGIEVARRIRDEERGGKAKLVIIGTISHCIHFNQPASELSIWGIEVTRERHALLRTMGEERKEAYLLCLPCDSALYVVFFSLYQLPRKETYGEERASPFLSGGEIPSRSAH